MLDKLDTMTKSQLRHLALDLENRLTMERLAHQGTREMLDAMHENYAALIRQHDVASSRHYGASEADAIKWLWDGMERPAPIPV